LRLTDAQLYHKPKNLTVIRNVTPTLDTLPLRFS
jgi:hypothetical protein